MSGRSGGRELDELATEGYRVESSHLDLQPTRALLDLMNSQDATVPETVGAVLDEVATAIDAIIKRLSTGGRLIYVGAGTSGRLALLDASECPPTFSTNPEQVQAVMAGGNEAFVASIEAVEDNAAAGKAALAERSVGAWDAVVGISASGRTPFVLGAVDHARSRGALTIGISCNPHAALSGSVDHAIEVVTGPEVVSGSTRLKAGTAQKLLLNMISTVTMVRLGKTYGDLMVDLKATNEKLRRRARRVVKAVTGEDGPAVERAFTESGEDTKTAIVMLLRGCSAADALDLLSRHDGVLRRALEAQG